LLGSFMVRINLMKGRIFDLYQEMAEAGDIPVTEWMSSLLELDFRAGHCPLSYCLSLLSLLAAFHFQRVCRICLMYIHCSDEED